MTISRISVLGGGAWGTALAQTCARAGRDVTLWEFDAGNAELTGTGDGQLWGFVPDAASSNGESVLVQIDPATGKTLESYTYPSLVSSGSVSWAVKFWGGSFWIFFNDSIYQVSRDSPEIIHAALSKTGRNVVGAGVSTCAPLL